MWKWGEHEKAQKTLGFRSKDFIPNVLHNQLAMTKFHWNLVNGFESVALAFTFFYQKELLPENIARTAKYNSTEDNRYLKNDH